MIPAPPHAPRMPCPRCAQAVVGEVTDVGTRFECARCQLEWYEGMPLDFSND